jgi:predicted Zn-dependent protease
VQTDPALPAYGAARWDDDGVATTAAPIITKGTLTDYLGTRWNRRMLTTMPSVGTTTAADVQRAPRGIPASVQVHASTGRADLLALARELRDGVLVRETSWVMTDQQCAGATIFPNMLFEVKRGQIVRRLVDMHVTVTTKKFWMGLLALGDASTVRLGVQEEYDGPPWSEVTRVTAAPAAHFKEADIVSRTGGRV